MLLQFVYIFFKIHPEHFRLVLSQAAPLGIYLNKRQLVMLHLSVIPAEGYLTEEIEREKARNE